MERSLSLVCCETKRSWESTDAFDLCLIASNKQMYFHPHLLYIPCCNCTLDGGMADDWQAALRCVTASTPGSMSFAPHLAPDMGSKHVSMHEAIIQPN